MQRQATLQGGEVARQMGMGRENLIAQGQGGADRMIMQGEAAVQGAEFGRESTLLASEYGLLAGANNALQGAEGNVMSSLAAEADMYGSRAQAQNANRSNMLNTGMHEYLEDPTKERFYEVEFNNGSKVNVCDMHKIKCIAAKDITENVLSKKVYGGVKFSYDLLTEDLGYRIDGIPVNSMIAEMAGLITELKNK